ncbi:PEP-CTERM sorting domain-containing protein [bacterium]|nr:PEP-CTERM sorting domain-containing protein [bacterium]
MSHCSAKGPFLVIGTLLTLLGAETPARAQGSIVYHGPVDVLLISSGAESYTYGIDMNEDGTEDFVFRAFNSFGVYSTTGGLTVGVPKGGFDLGNWSIPLSDGFSIGPILEDPLQWTASQQGMFDWIGATLHIRNTSGSSGYWNPPPGSLLIAYVGTEFMLADGAHYGWIRVQVAGIGNGGIIKDWAYNSIPGQPILAGQVPEPSTWALITAGSVLLLVHLRHQFVGSRSSSRRPATN